MADLTFQALSWSGADKEEEDGTLHYRLDVYGRTKDGASVCVHTSFTPYFFVELPDDADQTDVDDLVEALTRGLCPKDEPRQLKDTKVIYRVPIYGFCNFNKARFLRVVVHSKKAKMDAERIVRSKRYGRFNNTRYELYESNIPCELRVLHVRNIESAGWIRVSQPDYHPDFDRETTCRIEATCHYTQLFPSTEHAGLAPIVVASFDVECMSPDGSFPDPTKECPVIQVATTFWRYGDEEPYKRHIVCLKETEPLPGVDMVCVEREADLLKAWADVLRAEDADVLLGYNIWGFDLNFMYQRAAHALGGFSRFADVDREDKPGLRGFLYGLGKRKGARVELLNRTLDTSAYGHNEFLVPTTPGMLQVDLLPVIKKEHKLSSYKLEAVATHFLGEHKVDLPIKEMFALYRGSAADRSRVAQYCVQDTVLPLRLLQRLAILENMVEMAKATHVPVDWLIFKGQHIKVFSLITKKARELGFLCPSKPRVVKEEGGKYQGATVLEAQVGAHWNGITCLDFASLYPSIMRAHVMCHSTVVLDDTRYGHIPGIQYEEVQVEEGKPPVKFAQVPTEKTVLPALLADLALYRKQARKEQKAAADRGDQAMAAVYNGEQLAYKISSNSTYGFLGASNGYMPILPIAASITTRGREMIQHTKDMVEQAYASRGTKVVYGDSVSGATPVVLRLQGCICLITIEEIVASLGLPWTLCWEWGRIGKEICCLENTGIEVWTEEGWTKLRFIIRHLLAPTKRMLRGGHSRWGGGRHRRPLPITRGWHHGVSQERQGRPGAAALPAACWDGRPARGPSGCLRHGPGAGAVWQGCQSA